MSISDLKDILIYRINAIEDENFLNALKILTDSEAIDEPYELSEFERNKIAHARQQVNDGKTVSHKEVVEKVHAWLKK